MSPRSLVEETQEQRGGHTRIPWHLDALGLGPCEAVFEQGQASLGIELTAGGDAEHRRGVGQEAGDRGLGAGVHVGPAPEVQLLSDAVALGRRCDHPLDELILEFGHNGRKDGGLGLEVVVERARVTPARRAIWSRLVAAKPWSANSSLAALTRAERVVAERSAWRAPGRPGGRRRSGPRVWSRWSSRSWLIVPG